MARRRYNSSKRKKRFGGAKVFLAVLVVALLASVGAAYAGVSPFVDAKESAANFFGDLNLGIKSDIGSKFDVELTEIGFKSSGIAVGGMVIGADTLSIPGDSLRFGVDIIPKDSFTGEPFNTVELGNKDIGFKTFVQSTPWVYVVLLSRDGYYFSSHGPLTWTPEELQLPDESERDYYKSQSMMKRRTKSVILTAPSSDKAVVALLQDSNELMKKLEREQWERVAKGDWFSEKSVPTWSKLKDLFNKYFKVVIVEKEQWLKLKSLD